jgi:hypothetical protein
MNIRYLQEIMARSSEIAVLGKSAEIDGVVCQVVGAVREGLKVRLLVLQYDAGFQERIEAAETEAVHEPCEALEMTERRRMLMHCDPAMNALTPFGAAYKVQIGDCVFGVSQSETKRLHPQDWESLLILTEFLRQGWQPAGIDFQSLDMLFLSILELEGEYESVPAFDKNAAFHFDMRPIGVTYQVGLPITLSIDGTYEDKLWFKNADNGEVHWAQINRVYLLDPWEEMAKTFANPEVLDSMAPEQMAQIRSEFENRFREICPKGLYFPVIEYECEEGISLQIYSKAFLNGIDDSRRRSNRSSAMGFIVSPDQTTGFLGLKLKAACIQEPVPADTVQIEVELFQYHQASNTYEAVM